MTKQNTPETVTKCGLGRHKLKDDNRTIDNRNLLEFAKHLNRDIRSTTRICEECYASLKKVYRYKMRRAIARSKEALSVSSVSSTSLSQELKSITEMSSLTSTSSLTSLSTLSEEPTTSKAAKERSANKRKREMTLETHGHQPMTSQVAEEKSTHKRKRDGTPKKQDRQPASKNATQEILSSTTSDVDDDEYIRPSPNATNGTRLPHIQPIPKRRQFVTLHKEVMDMYMAGITGG